MADLQELYKDLGLDDEVIKKSRAELLRRAGIAAAAPGAVTLSGGESRRNSTAPEQAAGTRKRRRMRRLDETREELLARLLDPILTLEETARVLEVCPTTVRRYTNRGVLPHERSQGNQRRFKLSCVLAFMEFQGRVDVKSDHD